MSAARYRLQEANSGQIERRLTKGSGPVDAVTVGRTPDAVLFVGPHPDDVRVGPGKGDSA